MSRFNTGNPIGSGSPLDLDDNAKNFDEAALSDADTFQDRMGRSRLTWAGIVKAGTGDPAIAVDAAARAVAAAEQVEQNAEQIAQDAAQQAVQDVIAGVDGAVGRAEGAADRAETASGAAFVNADVFPDVATGRAAVAVGEQFQVVAGDEIVRYRKDSSTVATEVSRVANAAAFQRVDMLASRASAISGGYPISATATAANAGGNADLLKRIVAAIVDIRLFGLPSTDRYYIERIRRNYSGSWHIVIKRASDNASVLQMLGPLVEPTDPDDVMIVRIGGLVTGAYAFLAVRWGKLVSGAINTNLTVPISSDSVNRDHPSFLNTRMAYGARSTQVIVPVDPATNVTADPEALTLTWPALDIIAAEANIQARYRLNSGTLSFSGTRAEIAWLDLREAPAYGVGLIPASAVKVGTYTNTAARTPNDYVAESYQLPLAWSAGAGRVDLNPMLRTQGGSPGPTPEQGFGDAIAVFRDLANNVVSVYYPATTRRNSDKYIHVRLLHWVASDADAWTIGGVWEVQRTGYESFTVGKRLIVEATEILAAFQEQGAVDFMGSRAHGDEVMMADPTLLIDGKEVSMSSGSASWHHGEVVTLAEQTRMYRVGSVRTVPLIERSLLLEFRDGQIYANQRFKFLEDISLSNGYCAMMAPCRYEDFVGGTSEDTSSAQISGKYIHDNAIIPRDISARQAAVNPVEDYSRPTPRVTHVKMWGTYGVEFELEVLEASDILKDIFFIQRNNYAYNKAYIGFIGGYSGVQEVTQGQQWSIKTRMSIKSSN